MHLLLFLGNFHVSTHDFVYDIKFSTLHCYVEKQRQPEITGTSDMSQNISRQVFNAEQEVMLEEFFIKASKMQAQRMPESLRISLRNATRKHFVNHGYSTNLLVRTGSQVSGSIIKMCPCDDQRQPAYQFQQA